MPAKPTTEHSPESLKAIADELQAHASALQALSTAMGSLGFKSLPITNNETRKRGLEFVENFVNAVRATLREAREDRGDFNAKNGTSSPEPSTPRKSKK